MKSGLAFVASHLTIVHGKLPVLLAPNHLFRAAKEDEVERIRDLLKTALPDTGMFRPPYEQRVLEEPRGSGKSIHTEELPKDQWKYWVIAFEGDNGKVVTIERLAQLLPFNFDLGFQVFFEGIVQTGGTRGWQSMPLHVLERIQWPFSKHPNGQEVDTRDLAQMERYYGLLQALPDRHKFVDVALSNFADLRRIPDSSPLLVVGLFSIIESLITHAPRLAETLDSINHQITSKILLLRKKYERQICLDSGERRGNRLSARQY